MSNEDRRNRSDRLKRRFERGDDRASDNESGQQMTAETSKMSKTEQTEDTEKTAITSQTPVKDRPSVLMYLPEEVHEELDIRFDELNAKHKRAYGEKLEKNRDYYPAVVKAGLEGLDLEEVLDI